MLLFLACSDNATCGDNALCASGKCSCGVTFKEDSDTGACVARGIYIDFHLNIRINKHEKSVET